MRLILLSLLGLLSLASMAQAQSVLLVHGYHGNAQSWRKTGIAPLLQRNGWWDAGFLTMRRHGVFYYGVQPKNTSKQFYTVNLPSEAPIERQASMLSHYVGFLKRAHPKQPVIIVGHSAGGIIARYMMVRSPQLNIDTLITIASPHLGSQTAEVGRMIGNSPLSFFAPFMGAGTINRSQTLYHQLSRENPGNLLGWLNRTRHPKARYISIIHSKSPNPAAGDSVIKGWRQDMNFVPALKGQARSYVLPSDHELTPRDGVALIQILSNLKR